MIMKAVTVKFYLINVFIFQRKKDLKMHSDYPSTLFLREKICLSRKISILPNNVVRAFIYKERKYQIIKKPKGWKCDEMGF